MMTPFFCFSNHAQVIQSPHRSQELLQRCRQEARGTALLLLCLNLAWYSCIIWIGHPCHRNRDWSNHWRVCFNHCILNIKYMLNSFCFQGLLHVPQVCFQVDIPCLLWSSNVSGSSTPLMSTTTPPIHRTIRHTIKTVLSITCISVDIQLLLPYCRRALHRQEVKDNHVYRVVWCELTCYSKQTKGTTSSCTGNER